MRNSAHDENQRSTPQSRYFKITMNKMSLAECWNFTHDWRFLLMCVVKWVRLPLLAPTLLSRPDPISNRQIAKEDVPEDVYDRIDTSINELMELGFHSPIYYVYRPEVCLSEAYGVLFLSSSGEMVASVLYVLLDDPYATEDLTVCLLSRVNNGPCLVTSNKPKTLDTAPDFRIQRIAGASSGELLESHECWIRSGIDGPVVPIRSVEEMIELAEWNEQRDFEFRIRRGLYQPMSPKEVAKAKADVAARSRNHNRID